VPSKQQAETNEHYEISFADPISKNRRIANAADENQAQAVANGFKTEGLKDVQIHHVANTATPIPVEAPPAGEDA
jgi:hypothetical protein